MIKKFICMLGVGGCLFFSGCSNDVTTAEGDGIQPILFSASQVGATTEVLTKSDAPAAFPHSSIAIVAANSNGTVASTDWTKLYLSHVQATAGAGTIKSVTNNGATTSVTSYPITLSSTTYWPFNPDEYLEFVAYSPASNDALAHSNTATSTDLTVTVNGTDKKFFDLLYTTPTAALNKTNGTVDLGAFNHAMAKLVIKVTPVDAITGALVEEDAIKDLKIEKLSVQTKVTTGKLNINSGAATWELTNPANGTTYTLSQTFISSSTVLPYDSEEQNINCYLFPATTAVKTVELSSVAFKLKDKTIVSVDDTYTIDQFIDASKNPVKLEMGKTTILNIKVNVTSVQTGDDDRTQLEGTLRDWIYNGSSSVTIE